MENALEEALERDQLHLLYQPQYECQSLTMVGVEALARWISQDGQSIRPDIFIQIAESSGLIGPLGDWVLWKACREALHWNELKLAVNLSPVQLKDRELTSRVEKILAETGFPASRLELEITETSLLDDSQLARTTLNELTSMGISIAMDDFGTGYSSLMYIKQFPISQLKVDRSFINTLASNHNDYKLMKAIVQMSKALGIQTVAEGVETVEQLKLLRDLECHVLQGFLFSKPVPADTIESLGRSLSLEE